MKMATCVVCGREAEIDTDNTLRRSVNCPNCTTYTITLGAETHIPEERDFQQKKHYLAGYLRESDTDVVIDNYNWRELCETAEHHAPKTVREQMILLLRHVSRQARSIGKTVTIHYYPAIIYAVSEEDVRAFISQSIRKGYLKGNILNTFSCCAITYDGAELIETEASENMQHNSSSVNISGSHNQVVVTHGNSSHVEATYEVLTDDLEKFGLAVESIIKALEHEDSLSDEEKNDLAEILQDSQKTLSSDTPLVSVVKRAAKVMSEIIDYGKASATLVPLLNEAYNYLQPIVGKLVGTM